MRKIELLAPAKNLETGIAAINFGADAVYIGAQKFSARAAAANSIDDIGKLIKHAHLYNAKVYAAVNTILYNDELEDAERLITDLYNRGIDAIIIQDMGILEMSIPPVPIHASTQADNFDIERIKFLDKTGFSRIVLARELSIQQIKEIRGSTSCELEVFIHGALCVSLSGRCYMSASMGGRSANRGECAQPCRKSYILRDAAGEIVSGHKYPLSLKDLNQTANLQDIIDAGADSLKIEGRLKDINYVKNITAHYRIAIDNILEGKTDCTKASSGKVYFDFTPDPFRTFNRGYTDYFLKNKSLHSSESIRSYDTPKSLGKLMGRVSETGSNWFRIESSEKINNGDGLAFFDNNMNLTGVKVNRADADKIYPLSMNGIYKDAIVYRNNDAAFEKTLSLSKTERKIDVALILAETDNGFKLTLTDEDGYFSSSEISSSKDISRSDKADYEQIKKQLSKLGGTIFAASDIKIMFSENYFLPVSILNELRRNAVWKLLETRKANYKVKHSEIKKTQTIYPNKKIDFRYNVSNHLAEEFYKRHCAEEIEKAFEISPFRIDGPLMTTRLCLKHENNLCQKNPGNKSKYIEPFYLIDNNVKYRIEFDCKNCMMLIFKN
ncbi:MAG: U32 family peptidase [Spirochaetota bacterium]